VQHLEGERDAVQLMSIHKSKGLEADQCLPLRRLHAVARVFVRLFERDGKRWLFAGRPRRSDLDKALETGDGGRRPAPALRGAHARAATALPALRRRSDRRRIGAVRGFLARERRLSPRPPPPAGALPRRRGGGALRIEADRLPDAARRHARAHRRGRTGLAARADDLALDFPAAALAEARRRHAGVVLTSYTRIKQAQGGYQPPTEVLDEQPAPMPGPPPDPAACRAGRSPASSCTRRSRRCRSPASPGRLPRRTGPALPEIARSSTRPSAAPIAIPRTAPTPSASSTPPSRRRSRCRAARRSRAWRARRASRARSSSCSPSRPRRGRRRRRVRQGLHRLHLEHEGRAFFGDWKSDLLPDFSPVAVAAHVAANYELQAPALRARAREDARRRRRGRLRGALRRHGLRVPARAPGGPRDRAPELGRARGVGARARRRARAGRGGP